MHFTDIFIRRPVLAVVLSLFILVLGLRSIELLAIRQFPYTQNAVITVATIYTGSDPSVVSGFITTPLENSIAQANGIDYMTSSSTQNQSVIQANLRLNYDSSKAMTEVNAQVNAVLNQLPKDSQLPVVSLAVGEPIDSMYIGFYSDEMTSNKITDYLIRVVQPKLQAVEGVQVAEILGQRRFAMRAWLDPVKMAALDVTATDVSNALANNDYISAVGRTQGQMVTVNLVADTTIHTVEEFSNLVLKTQGNAIVRLGDVAKVTLGSEDYDTQVSFDGSRATYIGIKVAPTANLLAVIDGVRKAFPSIAEQLPQGLNGRIVYDATKYVNSSIREVIITIFESLLIVTIVTFLFLATLRSVIIPTVAIPLSLIGSFFIMLILGYTINLLTLLALVLAIGLVVDDAIIIVENAHRHIEDGLPPFEAAIRGTRELAGPIVAITAVLISVYIPIAFMGGLTGALFTEFAFTLAATVTVSAVIALTLSPMMCSRFLRPPGEKPGRFARLVNWIFESLRNLYGRMLSGALDYLPVTVILALIILTSNYFLYMGSKNELAPQEDQGIIISLITTAPDATLEQTQLNSREVFKICESYPETDHVFQFDGVSGLNTSIAGMVTKPWDERKRTTMELNPLVQRQMNTIAGATIVSFLRPPLPGSGRGLPVQFVIGTTESFDKLNQVSFAMLDRAVKSGLFGYVDTDLKVDRPQTVLDIDRDRAATLGLTMRDIGSALGFMLGGGYVNYFDLAGRSYKVIPQVEQRNRLTTDQLKNYYIKTAGGNSIPMSTILRLKRQVVPESLNHFQQLNAATLSAVPLPNVTLGQALDGLRAIARDVLPSGYSIDYGGESRQFMQESSALIITFFFSLIIIFLALAALFESFRDPLIILISVPMSICGAMIFISLGIGHASLNIYTEVGLVTLMGIISKHGILIVRFANDLQREGQSKRDAVEMAACVRLRPILMTTAAMVLGVLPLVMATGAGAEGRFHMGLVIMSGISIGTIFTLFMVPAMYLLLAAKKERVDDSAEELENRDMEKSK
ncbi:MAG TPA: efflux RND transporter permease subunit [Smithella sp.]|nr:efflux RND transporter permease subunit [Smithella sp.]